MDMMMSSTTTGRGRRAALQKERASCGHSLLSVVTLQCTAPIIREQFSSTELLLPLLLQCCGGCCYCNYYAALPSVQHCTALLSPSYCCCITSSALCLLHYCFLMATASDNLKRPTTFTITNRWALAVLQSRCEVATIRLLDKMFIGQCYVHDGAAAESLKAQARRYFHSYNFWLDIISIFPSDFVLIYRGDISLVRLNRLLKSYRFNYFIDRTEIRTNWPNAFKIFVLIMTCIVLFHWNAAAYFLISVISGIDNEDPDAWQFTYTKIADPVIPKCNTFLLTYDSTSCSFNETGRNVSNRLEYIDEMMQYWQNRSEILAFPNFSKEYALSIYWSSLTLTTKGQQPYPMSSLEDALEVIDTLIGLLVFAIIVGSVGSIISTMNKEKSEFQEILDGIKFYLNYRKVDSDIQKRVLNCCDYIHDQGISKDERVINFQLLFAKIIFEIPNILEKWFQLLLEGLPRKLHGQLAIHLHMVTLQHVELLQDCEQGLLFELILRLKFQLFSPNDYICRRGELARVGLFTTKLVLSKVQHDNSKLSRNAFIETEFLSNAVVQEMYIVKRGQLNCVSDDGKVVLGILKEGAVFGQLAILNLSGKTGGTKHTIAIRSIGYTDVYILRQEDVNDVLQEYPLARQNMMRKAIKMLQDGDYYDSKMTDENEVNGNTSTTEKQLDGIGKALNTLSDEINHFYEIFDHCKLVLNQFAEYVNEFQATTYQT
uniref:Cyclic nucleotide-binding domain-containing protein n=1 Tax=Setaria digitata TaxID=48799 RepID=A0A915PIM8_9BILA